MRRVRYNVAASLDGFIAGPAGEYDWIPMDPAVDFAAIFAKVDTVLLGRVSYEASIQAGPPPWGPGTRVFVFSSTLPATSHPGVTIERDAAATVARLRAEAGEGEIWLFGGGALFRTLLDAGQVDAVEVTVVPVLLGAGVPLVPPGAQRVLHLDRTHVHPSGMVSLIYSVPSPAADAAR
ncbi:MAG: folA 1 [Gemmatimonadetes bacterium]|jgi:dihydrofolate reductase|nr:folA 1 [Gemmatimonadota bacterium]